MTIGPDDPTITNTDPDEGDDFDPEMRLRFVGKPDGVIGSAFLGLNPYALLSVEGDLDAEGDPVVTLVIEVGGGVPLDAEATAKMLDNFSVMLREAIEQGMGDAVTEAVEQQRADTD